LLLFIKFPTPWVWCKRHIKEDQEKRHRQVEKKPIRSRGGRSKRDKKGLYFDGGKISQGGPNRKREKRKKKSKCGNAMSKAGAMMRKGRAAVKGRKKGSSEGPCLFRAWL